MLLQQALNKALSRATLKLPKGMHQETIFALSTVPGKSGVAIIRISGKDAFSALKTLSSDNPPPPRIATLRSLKNAAGDTIDQALVLTFAAPASFTGEDIVELHLHGSFAVIQSCLKELATMPGLRLAEAGEFARRAFEHGKLDLLEVEAIADVIDAETEAQLAQAQKQLSGYMSQAYEAMRFDILECLALIEAYIDFPEEDIPEQVIAQVSTTTKRLIERIEQSLKHSQIGERRRSGFEVAIIGEPNVGKSSLLNLLVKRDAAIVSPTPGTTRDVIDVRLNIGGYPVTLRDTAGIRDSADDIESMGIERSRKALNSADIILHILDATKPSIHLAKELPPHVPALHLANKIDLSANKTPNVPELGAVLGVSTKNAVGIELLEAKLLSLLQNMQPEEEPIVTQARHRNLLRMALRALYASSEPLPLELWAEELRIAARSIGEITGIILPDEVLGAIFSQFCIGK